MTANDVEGIKLTCNGSTLTSSLGLADSIVPMMVVGTDSEEKFGCKLGDMFEERVSR